uniref:Candidate secreted effector n=1 Tax=Meloidogyne incognita TaxID=6306 RepID=A0A914N4R5_MELIC
MRSQAFFSNFGWGSTKRGTLVIKRDSIRYLIPFKFCLTKNFFCRMKQVGGGGGGMGGLGGMGGGGGKRNK